MEDREFHLEQLHLKELYGKLVRMEHTLHAELAETDRKAAEEKEQQSEDLRLNFRNDEESQETLIEIETMSQAIQQLNIESRSAGEKLERVKSLLEKPYFARISLKFSPDEDAEDFYIGQTGLSDEHHDQLVTDWRAPIAEVYYNQENGMTAYEADGRKIPVELRLRRQFDLVRDELYDYFDTKVAIEDPMLLKSLSRKRTDRMQAITETIQAEQNAVIRHRDVPVLLVNGIAGSGKTSVLLQRIAYLFYRLRDRLRPDQVWLMTLNPVFQQYISHVLPNMGESNPNTLTWQDFLEEQNIKDSGKPDETDPESLLKLEKGLPEIHLDLSDLRAVRQKNAVILSETQILSVLHRHRKIPTSVRLMQVSVDILYEKAKSQAARLERKKNRDLASGEDGMTQGERNSLDNQYQEAFASVSSFEWLDIEHIGKRLLGTEKLTSVQYLYLKMLLTGVCERNARYVMIDEVQDYTLSQLILLKSWFRNARFMMLGDAYQAIREGTVSFPGIHELFENDGRAVTELSLMTSYRSSPEITELFTSLLPEQVKIRVSSVLRPGMKPEIYISSSREHFHTLIREKILHQENADGLVAVIGRDMASVNRITQLLGEDAPPVIRDEEALPERGTVLIPLRLAKGLEFDRVVIPDASEAAYPDDRLHRNQLYTALSRATEQLTVIAERKLTPLLEPFVQIS